jgi:transcriptional regulator
MGEKYISPERDRETTEKRLIDTIGKTIADTGFEKTGINAVAAQSGVSKILIYRYFGSIEGLMAAYIRKHDFWLNLPDETTDREHLPEYLKTMFRRQIERLRNDITLRRLYRWELSSGNDMIAQIRQQREATGISRIKRVCELSDHPQKDIEVMASVITASITYLTMLGEFCPVYNGIAINEESGWEQISAGIDTIIDTVFKNDNNEC